MKKKIPLTYPLDRWLALGLILPLVILLFTACTNAPAPGRVEKGQIIADLDPACLHNDMSLRKLPDMFVERDTSLKLEGAFVIKSGPLSDNLVAQGIQRNETEFIDYDTSSFNGMIRYFLLQGLDSLDVYFAAYRCKGCLAVPDNMEKTLTVLFAPVDKTNQIEGFYSLPEGSTGFDKIKNRLHKDTAQAWIDSFVVVKMPVIVGTIDAGFTDNHTDRVGSNRASLSDTRRIRYGMNNLKELLDEMQYQATTNKDTVGGIRLYFASFTNSGNYKGRFRRRLVIQLEFMHVQPNGRRSIFPLEEDPKFCLRPLGIPTKDRDENKGNDNGQMCPPSCVPPPTPPVNP